MPFEVFQAMYVFPFDRFTFFRDSFLTHIHFYSIISFYLLSNFVITSFNIFFYNSRHITVLCVFLQTYVYCIDFSLTGVDRFVYRLVPNLPRARIKVIAGFILGLDFRFFLICSHSLPFSLIDIIAQLGMSLKKFKKFYVFIQPRFAGHHTNTFYHTKLSFS